MVGEIIVAIGFVLFLIGIIGQFRYKTFFKRLIVASVIDSAGLILIFVGIIIRQGFSPFSLKVFIIMLLILVINPLATHKLGRSAYRSGLGENDDN